MISLWCRWGTMVALVLGLWLAAVGEAQAQQRGGHYYTVRQGDTLSEVARRHGMSAAELARDNRLRMNSNLVAGSRIWVARPPAAASSRVTRTPARPSIQPSTVRQPVRTNIPTNAPRPHAPTSHGTSPAPRPTVSPSSSPTVHVVQRGDSLWRIANRHGMEVNELARLNGLDPARPLQVGQRLRLRGPASSSGNDSAERLVEIPGGGVEQSSSKSRTQAAGDGTLRPSSRGFIWPVEGRVVRQFLNRPDEKYAGIDIAAPTGSEVRAARDGKVVYAGDSIPAYGRMVIVSHDGNLATCYAHNSRLLVREGQQVRRGQVIARSGDTGRGSEPFLHFQIRRDGDAVNPMPYLP